MPEAPKRSDFPDISDADWFNPCDLCGDAVEPDTATSVGGMS